MSKSGKARVLAGRLPIILTLAIIISTVHLIPLLPLKKLSYAEGVENVKLINAVPTGSDGQSAQLFTISNSTFISTDASTCALDKPNTYLQIECMNALPLLLPTFSPVANSLPTNISDINSTGETITDNETTSDIGSEFVNDSSFDNTTLGSFESGGSSSSSDSFDFSSGGGSSSDGSSSSSSTNHAPKADSQTIALNESESKTFALTGSDKDGDVLVFTNVSDPAHGTLIDNVPPDLTYKAKPGYTGNDAITFKVYDGIDFSKIATISFVVDKTPFSIVYQNDTTPRTGTNSAPISDAGLDQTVDENQTVSLDGSKSKDSDSDQLAYSWKDLDRNSKIKLHDSDTVTPSFVAPVVDKQTDIKIQLSVDDGKGGKSSDDVIITILKPNREPTADAGSDQSVESTKKVKLDGSKSSDPDGDKLTFTWEQMDGPKGKLNDKNSEKPTFTAPKVDKDSEVTISLTVEDKNKTKSTDDVKITVTPSTTTDLNAESLTVNNDANSNGDSKSNDDSKKNSDSKQVDSSSSSDSSNKDSSSKDSSSKDSSSKDSSTKDSSTKDSGADPGS
jgi:Bacterial Ig domain/PKD domain